MTMAYNTAPGVYTQHIFPTMAAGLRTGVPAFLGLAHDGPVEQPRRLSSLSEFAQTFGAPLPTGYLADTVRSFFANDGGLCYVVRLASETPAALSAGLAAIAGLENIDIVCAPDIMRPLRELEHSALERDRIWGRYVRQFNQRVPGPSHPLEVQIMQRAVLDHCMQQGDRFAILDALPAANPDEVREQRRALSGANGALYYPWVRIQTEAGRTRLVPPCGAVAGVYARSDQQSGVYKAPANETLAGVLDTEIALSTREQDVLSPQQINCLRARPKQGISVWGARTLSSDPAWRYINVRRLFLTVGRWVGYSLASVAFEPNSPQLWARIEREISAYCTELFERGALRGRTAQEAFFVACNAATNPIEVREAGQVVTTIGLAPVLPSEFVVVRLIHRASGVSIDGPIAPA